MGSNRYKTTELEYSGSFYIENFIIINYMAEKNLDLYLFRFWVKYSGSKFSLR